MASSRASYGGNHCAEDLLSPEAAARICQDVQHMIDINSEHLERLRTPMTSSSEITKQEIRTLEGKLIKHFSQQLATKASLNAQKHVDSSGISHYPSLSQWLKVVGITKESADILEHRVNSLDSLKDKTDSELNRLLLQAPKLTTSQRQEDLRRLSRALQNLRKYTDSLIHGNSRYSDVSNLELYWDSWDTTRPPPPSRGYHDPKHHRSNHIAAAAAAIREKNNRDDSASPKQDRLDSPPPITPTSKTIPKVDSAGSSLSSCGSNPPQSPGLTLSPPVITNYETAKKFVTPPTTPPWSMLKNNGNNKFPTTPPPVRKHSTGIQKSDFSLIKSTSHESELTNRISSVKDIPISPVPNSSEAKTLTCSGGAPALMSMVSSSSYTISTNSSCATRSSVSDNTENPDLSNMSHTPVFRQKRLQTEPVIDLDGHSPVASPRSPPNLFDNNEPLAHSTLQVPKSPRTPRSMGHLIKHRFTKTFKPGKCDHCSEYMFNGLKCKECKFRCHRDCESQVPPSCGLPEDLLRHYISQITKEGSPILPVRLPQTDPAILARFGMTQGSLMSTNPPIDSSSNTSSCNSSTPSSPAVVLVTSNPTPPHSASIYQKTKFMFPDPQINMKMHQEPSHMMKPSSPNPIVDSVKSTDSDKTLSGTSGSSGSAGTAIRLDSQDSTASVDESGSSWMATRQTSISLREWDIPYEELKIGDKIGSGRFSTVYQGKWHGDVAVKILDMENMEDEATLEAFRLDVATFRKTRHENVTLFMGACMNPPKLAIVTSLCKGKTLYTHLHLHKEKFSMNKIVIIAQQICQGMGYLHHRGIIHKDLKTKNIFLENGRAIITDFGLVNVARRLCSRQQFGSFSSLTERECMSIPKGWLCYLAPEIMRTLRVQPTEGEDLPFTKASDVYAFGTVWFELLTGEWPWKHQAPETIIWMVGKGMKPSLTNLSASRDVKEILVMCWTFKNDHRPDFAYLSTTLETIPKKRLARSPSHPVHLTRSAESTF